VLINCDDLGAKTDSLSNWQDLATIRNTLHDLEEEAHRIQQEEEEEVIFFELYRIAHRQFPWQINLPNSEYLMKHILLYSDESINSIIRRNVGVDYGQLVAVGMALYSLFQQSPKLEREAFLAAKNFGTPKELERCLAFYSTNISSIKNQAKTEHQIDHSFAFQYSSIRERPILLSTESKTVQMRCPIPLLIFWRFTNGVYYEVCNDRHFSNPFGKSFERLVSDILMKSNRSGKLQIISEISYQRRTLQQTSDFILVDSKKRAFLVECKASRPPQSLKTAKIGVPVIEDQMARIAKSVLQTYKVARDYEEGHWAPESNKINAISGSIIVTLENWFIMGTSHKRKLESLVREMLRKEKIDEAVLDTQPYVIVSSADLPRLLHAANSLGVQTVFSMLSKKKYVDWDVGGIMNDLGFDSGADLPRLYEEQYNNYFDQMKSKIAKGPAK
jgi:hypothetical protein